MRAFSLLFVAKMMYFVGLASSWQTCTALTCSFNIISNSYLDLNKCHVAMNNLPSKNMASSLQCLCFRNSRLNVTWSRKLANDGSDLYFFPLAFLLYAFFPLLFHPNAFFSLAFISVAFLPICFFYLIFFSNPQWRNLGFLRLRALSILPRF